MKVTMLLADSAQAVGNKLYILGGGWNVHAIGAPTAIALIIHVPWSESNKRHAVVLELIDSDGNPITIGSQRLEIKANFEVGRPPGTTAGADLPVPLALNIGPLPLDPDKRYEWRLSINGSTSDEWTLPFSTGQVVKGP